MAFFIMKKTYNIVFNFCFTFLLIGFLGIFTTNHAIRFLDTATASSINPLAACGIDKKVAYLAPNKNVMLINLKDGNETIVTDKFSEIDSMSLDLTLNKITVAGRLKTNDASKLNGVYMIDIEKGDISTICESRKYYFSPCLSSNQKFAAYIVSGKNDQFTPSNIELKNLDTNSVKSLTNQPETGENGIFYNYPRFSQAGDSIIYSKADIPDIDTPRYGSIYICQTPFTGGTESVIIGGATVYGTNGESNNEYKASVPNILAGNKIGFLKTVGNVSKSLALIDGLKSNEVTDILTDADNLARPDFSKDGKYVVFELYNDEQSKCSIQLYDINARATRKICETGEMPSID